MSIETSWIDMQTELAHAMSRPEYESVRPLLERLQIMANVQYHSPETVKGLFDIVKQMKARKNEGADLQELAKDAASGYIQPQMNVEGDLDQAGRDFFKQVSFNFFSGSVDELRSDEANPKITIPFVLLVMNRLEAQELYRGYVFENYNDEVYGQQFSQLREELEAANTCPNWEKRYGLTREQWQPFSDNSDTIAELISKALNRVDGYNNRIVPRFVDIETINHEDNRFKLKELREKGCVIIEDIISIRHPEIQRAYRKSLLDAFGSTIIVRVAPISHVFGIIQQLIAFSELYSDLEFYKRLNVDWDGRCNQVSGVAELGRWLKDQALKLLPDDEKSQSGWRSHMYK